MKHCKNQTIKSLIEIAKTPKASRVGVTIDVNQRSKQYVQKGYSNDCVMFSAKSTSLQKAEQKLLNIICSKNTPHNNVHKVSNYTKNKSGNVYVIVGNKK